jgi:hypothetical protein
VPLCTTVPEFCRWTCQDAGEDNVKVAVGPHWMDGVESAKLVAARHTSSGVTEVPPLIA